MGKRKEGETSRSYCLAGGCKEFRPADCLTCGFNRSEAARRKELPLVKDPETGLYRKYVGVGGADEVR